MIRHPGAEADRPRNYRVGKWRRGNIQRVGPWTGRSVASGPFRGSSF